MGYRTSILVIIRHSLLVGTLFLLMAVGVRFTGATVSAAPVAAESPSDAKRLALQHQLDYDAPFAYATFVGTHNSFNSSAYKGGLGVSLYPFPNQKETMTTQLDKGARALSLDIHELGGDIILCHAIDDILCASTDRLLTLGLNEISAWMNANTDAVVIIDIQDELNSNSERTSALSDIMNSDLAGMIYRPTDHYDNNSGTCRFLPMQDLTKAQMVLLIWNKLFKMTVYQI